MNPGIIFAVFTILLFGSWAVPTKGLRIDPKVQAFWLTVGHFFLSLLVYLLLFRPVSVGVFFVPFVAGVFWALGITAGFVGIRQLGMTRAVGIWIPVVILVSALWGLLFFREAWEMSWVTLMLTFASLALLISAAWMVILSAKGEEKLGNVKIGILASLVLGVLHGSFFVPLRTSALPIFITFFPLTLGMVMTTSCTAVLQRLQIRYDLFSTLRMILAGLILGVGNYTALLTIQFLGVAHGYPLTQLGIVVNTLWGALVFKELTTSKGKLFVGIGVVVAILGAMLLNFARTR